MIYEEIMSSDSKMQSISDFHSFFKKFAVKLNFQIFKTELMIYEEIMSSDSKMQSIFKKLSISDFHSFFKKFVMKFIFLFF